MSDDILSEYVEKYRLDPELAKMAFNIREESYKRVCNTLASLNERTCEQAVIVNQHEEIMRLRKKLEEFENEQKFVEFNDKNMPSGLSWFVVVGPEFECNVDDYGNGIAVHTGNERKRLILGYAEQDHYLRWWVDGVEENSNEDEYIEAFLPVKIPTIESLKV